MPGRAGLACLRHAHRVRIRECHGAHVRHGRRTARAVAAAVLQAVEAPGDGPDLPRHYTVSERRASPKAGRTTVRWLAESGRSWTSRRPSPRSDGPVLSAPLRIPRPDSGPCRPQSTCRQSTQCSTAMLRGSPPRLRQCKPKSQRPPPAMAMPPIVPRLRPSGPPPATATFTAHGCTRTAPRLVHPPPPPQMPQSLPGQPLYPPMPPVPSSMYPDMPPPAYEVARTHPMNIKQESVV